MQIVVNDTAYTETDDIQIQFQTESRAINAFDLVLARRAIHDAILQLEASDDDHSDTKIIIIPLVEERLSMRYDIEGGTFLLHPLNKTAEGFVTDIHQSVSLQFDQDEESTVAEPKAKFEVLECQYADSVNPFSSHTYGLHDTYQAALELAESLRPKNYVNDKIRILRILPDKTGRYKSSDGVTVYEECGTIE